MCGPNRLVLGLRAQCKSAFKETAGTNATVNGNALSSAESVACLGLSKWSTYVGKILRAFVRLSSFVRKLRRL